MIKTGDFNKEHFHQNLGKELALQGDDLREAHSAPNAFLERISQGRKGPYYKRNLPHICSFWVKVTRLYFCLGFIFFCRASAEEEKNVRTGTRSHQTQMIRFPFKILWIDFTVLKILLRTNF